MTPAEAIIALRELLAYAKREDAEADTDEEAVAIAIRAIRVVHCLPEE